MTSYSEEYKECPRCHCQYRIWNVASCNGIDAKFYTDGYIDGPMYDDGSRLIRCPKCDEIMWQEDIPNFVPAPNPVKSFDELPKDKPVEFYKEYYDMHREQSEEYRKYIEAFPIGSGIHGQEYEDILRKKFWQTPEQEKYVRIRTWWSINNAYRDNIHNYTTSLHKHEENLLALLELLNPDIPELDPDCSAFHLDDLGEPIMRAEVLRELGRFDECLKLADKISNATDSKLPPVDAIKQLALNKNKRVALYASD